MRMPFSRTNRRTRNVLVTPGTGLVVVSIVGVTLLLILVRVLVPGVFTSMATPLWRTGNHLTAQAGGVLSVFSNAATLGAERDRLQAENAMLLEQNAVLTARARDYAELLGTRTENTGGVLAGVLARSPVSPYDTLVIDQGSGVGVTPGARVTGKGGTPIGTIEEVTKASARVLLYSAPGRVSEGWVGEERLPITLTGAGAGALRAQVPREAGVVVGALVYLPGPGALPVGTVIAVDADPSSPRATVHIRPLANPFAITWVNVLRQ